jgi:hypothetical protein
VLSCGGGAVVKVKEGVKNRNAECRGSIMFSMILLREYRGIAVRIKKLHPCGHESGKEGNLQTNKPRDTKIQSARIHVKNTLTCKKQNICF